MADLAKDVATQVVEQLTARAKQKESGSPRSWSDEYPWRKRREVRARPLSDVQRYEWFLNQKYGPGGKVTEEERLEWQRLKREAGEVPKDGWG